MRYNKICIMVPTYKRSKTSLPVFIDSALATATLKNICFSFCVNKKDTETIDYLSQRDWDYGTEWEIIYEDLIQPNLAYYFNKMYDETKFDSSGTCVSMFGDDMVFKTYGWDEKFLNTINNYNGIGVFWADDNYIAHDQLCVNLVVTRKMVEATKHRFMCDLFHADMIDTIWMEVGKLTNTGHYLNDVIIQHNHSTKKPGEEWDETFMRLRPIQIQANSKGNQAMGRTYSVIIAGILNTEVSGATWDK